MSWLLLIRWKNLLIIFLTQFLAWWAVVPPDGYSVLTNINFALLSLSTISIAAAGYIINDYFDVKIDSINRPGKVVLERVIPRKQAMIAHSVLNFLALVFAGYVAVRAHHIEWLALQVTCTLLLWFYSTDFKRQFMTGNIVVAMLTALTIVTLIIYEPRLYNGRIMSASGKVLAVYAYFAFMLNWMREIVKDMEDYKGDSQAGCTTLPIVKGLQYAGRFTVVLGAIVVLSMIFAAAKLAMVHETWFACYITVFLVAPLVAWCFLLDRNTGPAHFSKASGALKIIMLFGIISLIFYHF